MPRLDYPTGDLEHGQEVQITQSLVSLPVIGGGVLYNDFESITVGTTAMRLSGALVSNATYCFITVETDKVRFRMGTDPSSTVGHELEAGDTLELESFAEMNAIRFIRSGTSDATIRASYGNR